MARIRAARVATMNSPMPMPGAPPVGGAPGIGMGLFIVATLAARMRAMDRHEPGEQGGARFILTLPARA